jgi:NAD(P)-dependent dehydrogenase (short-subunit alcohol dehydrogenase family)
VGRFGQPEEIAQVVELLITNSYMTDKVRSLCIVYLLAAY